MTIKLPIIGPSWLRGVEDDSQEASPLPPMSERGADVYDRIRAAIAASSSHAEPEQGWLYDLFRVEVDAREGRDGCATEAVEVAREAFTRATERGSVIERYLHDAFMTFDQLEPQDRASILVALDGRPIPFCNLTIPDLPKPGPIPHPEGAPGQILRDIDSLLRQIKAVPDHSEQTTLQNALATALWARHPGSLQRVDEPIFAPGTRGAGIMASTKTVLAAFDALNADSQALVLRWTGRDRTMIRVTTETPLDPDEN